MRAASVVAALLALAASAASREELSAEKAAGSAAPPSACGGQCHNKYDVKVGFVRPAFCAAPVCLSFHTGAKLAFHTRSLVYEKIQREIVIVLALKFYANIS